MLYMNGNKTYIFSRKTSRRTIKRELNNRLDYMMYKNSEIKDKLDKMEGESQKERENT